MTVEEEKIEEEEQNYNQESIDKLRKPRNIVLVGTIVISWTVSAVFSLISLNKGEGILETPWVLLSIFLTLVIIIFVIIPLFRNLRKGVKGVLAEKEMLKQEEKQETKE